MSFPRKRGSSFVRASKESKDIEYASVDNVAIYKFMDEVFSLPLNNQVAPFETSSDITDYLQEQWSGLFQHLLRESARQKEVILLEDLRGTVNTLNQLVTFLTEERRAGDQAIRDILLTNHPMFDDLRGKIEVPYRVFFTNKEELTSLLKSRRYKRVNPDNWDANTRRSHEEWFNDQVQPTRILKIAFEVFDENDKLNIFTPDEWKDEWVISYEIGKDDGSDDLPS